MTIYRLLPNPMDFYVHDPVPTIVLDGLTQPHPGGGRQVQTPPLSRPVSIRPTS
jgi:hypothetical protein